MITVVKAPPFATIQDLGWATGRAVGVPMSGAMDPDSLIIANLLAGNPRGDAAIEWALGPGVLRAEEDQMDPARLALEPLHRADERERIEPAPDAAAPEENAVLGLDSR